MDDKENLTSEGGKKLSKTVMERLNAIKEAIVGGFANYRTEARNKELAAKSKSTASKALANYKRVEPGAQTHLSEFYRDFVLKDQLPGTILRLDIQQKIPGNLTETFRWVVTGDRQPDGSVDCFAVVTRSDRNYYPTIADGGLVTPLIRKFEDNGAMAKTKEIYDTTEDRTINNMPNFYTSQVLNGNISLELLKLEPEADWFKVGEALQVLFKNPKVIGGVPLEVKRIDLMVKGQNDLPGSGWKKDDPVLEWRPAAATLPVPSMNTSKSGS